MTKLDKTKKEQLAVARKVLARYDVAFSILAKGDNSPHMTDEFKAKLIEAERQLQRYRVASSQ
jgi:hypothetical protein